MDCPQRQLRYAVVSPVKDEAQNIELTLRSMATQTVRPTTWIVVDDGSTDGTQEVVRRYAETYPFIRLIQGRTAGPRQTGWAEVDAFNRGYALLNPAEHDLIVKLDGDLSFGPTYFEALLTRFRSDERLGIASGVYLEADRNGVWTPVAMPTYHAFGACKVVRQRCFEEIGGFVSRAGWDTADEVRALTRGWKTGHFPDLHVRHHKPEGSGMGFLKTSAMHGEIHYVTGGHPLFLAAKAVHRLKSSPVLFSSLALLFGYLRAVARRQTKLVTSEEALMYRRLMHDRVWRRAGRRLPEVQPQPW